MATIYIGSARIDENGKTSGGAAGDQKQIATPDYKGEVSMQTMYTHSKGWYILRPKTVALANALAEAMTQACNNIYIGYDQNQRTTVITYLNKYGTLKAIVVKCECDCSSLVRACIIQGGGKDPGNFTTATEVTMLAATGLFEAKVEYVSQAKTPVYNGDVLVTKTKGHTVVVVSGNPRSTSSTSATLSTELQSAKSKDTSLTGTYKTTGSLNLRYGPDKDKYAVMVVMPKGTSCRCYGFYTTTSGTKWLYVVATVNGKKYTA